MKHSKWVNDSSNFIQKKNIKQVIRNIYNEVTDFIKV